MKTFHEVAIDALEETRDKLRRYWPNITDEQYQAVNFTLGLFTGIVTRRMNGDPDPDPLVSEERTHGISN